MADSVEVEVMRIVTEILGVPREKVRLGAKIFDDLGADSLAAEDIIQAMEKSFGVKIAAEAASEIETVGELVEHIKRSGGRRP